MKNRSLWARPASSATQCLLAICILGAVGWGFPAHVVGAEKTPSLEELLENEVTVLVGTPSLAGIVTGQGKVATLCHRLAGASSHEVQTRDGRRYAARLVAADQDRNVCILQADGLPSPAVAIADARSSDQTKVANVLIEKDGQHSVSALQVGYMGKVVDGTYLGLVASLLSSQTFVVRDGAAVYDWQGRLIGMVSTDVSGPSPRVMVLPVEWLAHVDAKMLPPDLPLTTIAWMNQARAYDAREDRAGLVQNNLKWAKERPQSAWAWNNLGNAYMFSREEDKLAKGKAAYQRAVELDPKLASAWSNLGNAYADSRETVRAIDAYRNATRVDPAYSIAWKNLANLYVKNGQRAEAVSTLKLAASAGKGGERARALNDLALLQEDPKEAAETLRMAAMESPDDPLVWSSLGATFAKAGDLEKSIRAYETAVRIGPRFLTPWVSLGVVYMHAKQPAAALQAFRMASAIDPKYAPAWKWQGVLLADHERDHKRAIAAYLEASKNGDNSADLWSALGVSYLQDKQLDRAREAYLQSIQREPAVVLHRARLSWLYVTQGQLNEAAQVAEEAVKLGPLDVVAWNALGIVRIHQKQWPQAVAANRRATELDPKLTIAWINLGTSLNEAGQFSEAKSAAKQALSLEPGNHDAQVTLGVSYIRNKEFAAAVDSFERLSTAKPDDVLVLANLTAAYRRAGKIEEAGKTYLRLQKLDAAFAQRVYDEELKIQSSAQPL